MRTARSSSRQLGGSASVHAGIHQPPSLGVGLKIPPWVWAWRTPPPGVGLENPPPRCGPGDPPGDLQGMLGYHPPPCTEFLIHATENITLPQTSFAGVKYG